MKNRHSASEYPSKAFVRHERDVATVLQYDADISPSEFRPDEPQSNGELVERIR